MVCDLTCFNGGTCQMNTQLDGRRKRSTGSIGGTGGLPPPPKSCICPPGYSGSFCEYGTNIFKYNYGT